MENWQSARSVDWSESNASRTASVIRTHIPASLATAPLRATKREQWTKVISDVAKTAPGAAAHLYTTVSSFLSHAEAHGWIDHHLLPRNGRKLIAPHRPARTRVLSDAEWLAIWRASDAEAPKLRAFIRLTLLCATRVGETSGIRVGEVSSTRTYWTLPAAANGTRRTKNARAHTMPLCGLARAELLAVWPLDVEDAADPHHHLLGRSGMTQFSGTGKLLARLQQRSGTTNWTWHDIRRTARTTMTMLDVREPDAEAALNHATGSSKLITVYDRSGPPPSAFSGLSRWQEYVGAVVSGERQPGDAERALLSCLPEDIRHHWQQQRSQQYVPPKKAKPGRKPGRSNTGRPTGAGSSDTSDPITRMSHTNDV